MLLVSLSSYTKYPILSRVNLIGVNDPTQDLTQLSMKTDKNLTNVLKIFFCEIF